MAVSGELLADLPKAEGFLKGDRSLFETGDDVDEPGSCLLIADGVDTRVEAFSIKGVLLGHDYLLVG